MEFRATMEDLLGQPLGPYQIVHLLGRGGMAVVYLAQDTRYGYTVALKVLPPYFRHDPAFAKRFRREVEAARALMHPNIVRVYEAGEDKGYLYMAMEYLDDGSLQKRLEAGRHLNLAVASAVVAQLGSALDFAHARGVVHRDVKPGNILFARDGRIVLSDFGIAKLRWESSLTGSGQMPGTVPYLSPEQVEGSAATALSDLWSLGVVLYQMVAGRLPFSGEHEAAVLYAIVHKPAPSPSQVNPALPPSMEPVIMRALAKEPQARFHSGAEMAAALRQAITPPPRPALVSEVPTVLAPPPAPGRPLTPPPGPTRPPTPPGPTPVTIGPLIIMAIALLTIFGVLFLARELEGGHGTPTPTVTAVGPTATATIMLPTVTLAPTPRTPTLTAVPGPAALAGPPTVLTSFLVGPQPFGLGVDPGRHRLFVGNYAGDLINTNTIYVFDTSTMPSSLVKARGYISHPWGVAVNTKLGRFYVSSFDQNYIVASNSDTADPVNYIVTGDGPAGIAVDEATNRVFVANYRSNSVAVVDGNTNTVIAIIGVARGPMGIALDPVLRRAYVTCYEDSMVDVIDTGVYGVISHFTYTTFRPSGIAVDPNTHYIYIANSDAPSTDLTIIDRDNNRIAHPSLTVGTRPVGVIYNPLTQRVFVNCSNVNKVYVVETSTNQVSYILDVQQRPDIGIALDPVANRIYVGNVNSNSVTIIQDGSPTPTRTYMLVPLPTNTPTATSTPILTVPHPTVTDTPVPGPTDTPTPPPSQRLVPTLIGPGNGDTFTEQFQEVEFSWQSVPGLALGQHYVLILYWKDGSQPWREEIDRGTTTSWKMPKGRYFNRHDDAKYEWQVQVRNADGSPAGPASELRYFFWRDTSPKPTPTQEPQPTPTATHAKPKPRPTPAPAVTPAPATPVPSKAPQK